MLLNEIDCRFIEENYLWFTIEGTDKIKWVVKVCASYDTKSKRIILNQKWENYLEWKFTLEIFFTKNNFPKVVETQGRLKRGTDYHIYSDWSFCIAHPLFEKKYKNKSFKFIIEHFIIPFLYNQMFYEKNWRFLWEYWHWLEGSLEYINDNSVSKEDYLLILRSFKNRLSKLSLQEFKKIFYSNKFIDTIKLSPSAKRWFLKLKNYTLNHRKLFTKI